MTTQIPCRAKNPDTCVYHSAERRAEAALLRGDADTWLRETENMLRNSDIEEVQAFIASYANTNNDNQVPGRIPLNPGHRYEKPNTTALAHLEHGLTRAHVTFDARFNQAIKDINNGEPITRYTVGGTPEDITNEPHNALRTAYQRTADEILELGDAPTRYDRTDPDTYRFDRIALSRRIAVLLEEEQRHGTPETVNAYEHTLTILRNLPTDDDDTIHTKTALQHLDTTYWEQAAQIPVPETPAIPYGQRFNDAYFDNDTHFNLHGVTPYTHALTPYQRALIDAAETIHVRTEAVDTDRTATQIVTKTGGRNPLMEHLANQAADADNENAARAYRDVQQLVSQSMPVYLAPGNFGGTDTYDLLQGVEKLFTQKNN